MPATGFGKTIYPPFMPASKSWSSGHFSACDISQFYNSDASLNMESAKRKTVFTEPSSKRVKLLDDESGDESAEVELKVNHEYAKRFEHNKQREELHIRTCSLSFCSTKHLIVYSRGEVRKERQSRIRKR